MRKLIILIAIIFGGVLSAQNSKVETLTLVPKAAPSVGLGKVYFGLDGSLNIYDGVAWRYSILSNDAQFIANSAKIGITPTQAADILLNNAKVGITPTQAADIVLNNAKVGITPTQASNITLNNAKATNATHTGDVTGSGTLTIASNAVTGDKILNGTVSFADMAINSIGAQNIIDGSVTTPDLQSGSVTNDKIFDNAVSEIKISNNAVTSAKIVDGTIVAGDIANNTITGAKIAPLTIGNSNLAVQSVNSSIIADLGVNTVDLADNAVTSAKILNGTISFADMSATGTPSATTYLRGDNTWGTPAGGGGTPDDNSVTSAKILDGTIVNADINETAAVSANKLANTPTGNLSSTTVQGALNELQGDITTITSAAPLQITASRALTNTDLNRVLWSNSGTALNLTINTGLGSDGDVIYLMPYAANSVLKPIAGTGTLLNTFQTDVNIGNVLTYKKVNNVWIADPRDGIAYVGCTANVNEKYIESSAASDPNCNESNSVGSFGSNNPANMTITTTTDADTGTYAIENKMILGGVGAYGSYLIGSINGDTYTITYRMKTTQSTGSTGVTAWENVTGGPVSDYIEPAAGWVTRTHNVTATGDIRMRFYASAGATGALNDNIIIDNLSIIKTN
jgi:hypothetical protein